MKILVVSPTPSHPPTAGNRARIESLMHRMIALGHEVHFMHVMREFGDESGMRQAWGERYYPIPYRQPQYRYRDLARRLGRKFNLDYGYRYGIDEWYDHSIDGHARDLCRTIQPHAVIVEYVFLSRVLQSFPPHVLKLIDTHDVFSDRHRRYLAHGQTATWFSTTERDEARALDRADVVIAIQRHEADYFRSITRRHVITVGHMVTLGQPSGMLIGNRRILVVGSENPINVQSLQRFLANVMPRVRAQIPDAELAVAGTLCRGLKDLEGITLLGELSDLEPAYRSARVVVNPVLFGTGLKVKSIEALGYGKPLVTTPCGADGLEHAAPRALRVSATAMAFADEIISLLTVDTAAASLAKTARLFAASWNQECILELAQILQGAAGVRGQALAEK